MTGVHLGTEGDPHGGKATPRRDIASPRFHESRGLDFFGTPSSEKTKAVKESDS